MANRSVAITPTELTGYAKAMQEAGIVRWTVTAEKPDGTRLTITAGEQSTSRNEVDRMLGLD